MKLKWMVAAFLLLVLIGMGFGAFEIHKTVTIEVEGEETFLQFWGFTVQEALTAAQIPIATGDLITPPLESRITENGTVRITRALWVVIRAEGDSTTLWTAERVPANLIQQANIPLAADDLVFANEALIDPNQPLPYQNSHFLQIKRATPIAVDDDGETHSLRSTAATLGDALSGAGIILNSADQIEPPLDTPLEGQEIQVAIKRAQEVTILSRDGEITARVVANTVGEALSGAGLGLQGLNYSIPPETAPLPNDGQIRRVEVREEIILEQDPIPFGLQEQALPEVALDTRQIVQVGEYGITARRVRVVYEDGEEISRAVEDEWVAKQPQPRIAGYGTKITTQTAQTAEGPIQYWRKVEVFATSYSPCNIGVPGKCSSHTASGKVPAKGMIAVIRSWYNQMQGLPVYVTSYGFATIEDLGAGFSDRPWIDLAFTDEEYSGWSGWVTLYFLTPVPANVMWVLE